MSATPIVHATGVRRLMYKMFGWSFLGLGAVGVVVPGVPTTPFVILSSYFFVRSSPQVHDWLLKSRLFGQVLHDWEDYHGVSRAVKYTAVGLMCLGLVLTTLLASLPWYVLAAIVALEFVGLTYVLRLPIVEHPTLSSPLPAPAAG
jgi:uncharacterized protein